MSKTSTFLSEADKAVDNTAKELTSLLRENLLARGWSFEAAMSVSLFYTGERFDYKFEGPYADDAQTLEFGTEVIRPTAEVRKFLNKNELIEKVYLKNLESGLGDLI